MGGGEGHPRPLTGSYRIASRAALCRFIPCPHIWTHLILSYRTAPYPSHRIVSRPVVLLSSRAPGDAGEKGAFLARSLCQTPAWIRTSSSPRRGWRSSRDASPSSSTSAERSATTSRRGGMPSPPPSSDVEAFVRKRLAERRRQRLGRGREVDPGPARALPSAGAPNGPIRTLAPMTCASTQQSTRAEFPAKDGRRWFGCGRGLQRASQRWPRASLPSVAGAGRTGKTNATAPAVASSRAPAD